MIIQPNIKNFIKSLREVGYSFEVAVADLIDNSISARAEKINIYSNMEKEFSFSILDDGIGMDNNELVEAMRLGSKDPDQERKKEDLGRFGIGLKTASFSQCKQLTVISKKADNIVGLQWDLDLVIEKNEWYIKELNNHDLTEVELISKLNKLDSGTLVIWGKIDSIDTEYYVNVLFNLKKHLSLVFHRYLDGEYSKLNINLNNSPILPFNPFYEHSTFTQKLEVERFKVSSLDENFITVSPFVLPHHTNLKSLEYEQLGTTDGFNKTQGFYLYRNGRLLVHSTWWGLTKASEAFKLIRIKIDIGNSEDSLWNINVMKSTARPNHQIRKELKRILVPALEKGKSVYTKRGKRTRYDPKKFIPIWNKNEYDEKISFTINRKHPFYIFVKENSLNEDMFENYMKLLESYLPIDAIYSELISKPKKVNQVSLLVKEELKEVINNSSIPEELLKPLLESGIFSEKGEGKYE